MKETTRPSRTPVERAGDSGGRKTSQFPDWLMCLVLAAFAIGIYSNTIGGPFVFDDHENIHRNPQLRIHRLDVQTLYNAGFKSLLSSRPVSNISFALNYYAHGYRVDGYHWVNILIHTINGILLYLFLKQTLALGGPGSYGGAGTRGRDPAPIRSMSAEVASQVAFFSALLWVVHPVQTQAVAYIVQRMTSMAVMFYMAAILVYVHARMASTTGRSAVLWAASGVAGILAMGSKEIAMTLPAVILLYEFFFFQDLKINRAWMAALLLVQVVFAGAFILTMGGADPVRFILDPYQSRGFSLGQRVLTEFRVVIFYLTLIAFPHPSRLSLDHDFTLSNSLLDPPTTLAAIILILGLAVVAGVRAKRNRFFSFCIFWFLGNLVLESSVIALEIVFEHRLYLPSMMLSSLIVCFIFRYVKPEWLKYGIIGGVILICAFWTVDRNHVWQNEIAMHEDTVAKAPRKARPYYGLGRALAERGEYDSAVGYLQEAVRLDPGYIQARNRLGSVLAMQGEAESAAAQFQKVIELDPNYAGAYFNLGVFHENRGNFAVAATQFRQAAYLAPAMAPALYRLAWLLSVCPDDQVRNGPEALAWAERLMHITGNQDPLALAVMAAAQAENGHFDTAARLAHQAAATAKTYGMGELENKVRTHLEVYKSGRPFREPLIR